MPVDHDSGSSIRLQKDARGGNKALKNLLVFSCTPSWGRRSASGSTTTLGTARGMRHSKALKAVARKRLRVIYAMMRDGVPYVEPPAGDVEKSPATA